MRALPASRLLIPVFAALLLGLPAAFVIIASAGPNAASSEAAPASRGNSLAGLAFLAWPTPIPTATPEPEPTPTPPAAPVLTARTAPPTIAAQQPPPAPPPAQPPPTPPSQWPDAGFAASVLAGVNAQRSSAGLPPLSASPSLSSAAESYALAVLELGYLSHSADGRDTWGRASAAGYAGPGPVGESLWSGTGSLGPERAVADWMASPQHRAMLLNPAYTQAGIGCYFRDGGPKAVCDLILVG